MAAKKDVSRPTREGPGSWERNSVALTVNTFERQGLGAPFPDEKQTRRLSRGQDGLGTRLPPCPSCAASVANLTLGKWLSSLGRLSPRHRAQAWLMAAVSDDSWDS